MLRSRVRRYLRLELLLRLPRQRHRSHESSLITPCLQISICTQYLFYLGRLHRWRTAVVGNIWCGGSSDEEGWSTMDDGRGENKIWMSAWIKVEGLLGVESLDCLW